MNRGERSTFDSCGDEDHRNLPRILWNDVERSLMRQYKEIKRTGNG